MLGRSVQYIKPRRHEPTVALDEGTTLLAPIAAVTQWPTNDLFDIDADGLPDSYEMAQFGSLSVSDGTADYDGDGVSDAGE